MEWHKSIKKEKSESSEDFALASSEAGTESQSAVVALDSAIVQVSDESSSDIGTDDLISEELNENRSSNVDSNKKKDDSSVSLEDEKEVKKAPSPWLSIFPMIMIGGGAMLPYLALTKDLIPLLFATIILTILGYYLFQIFRGHARTEDKNYRVVVSLFYSTTLTFHICVALFLTAIELSYEESPILPFNLAYYWVLFALLLISIIRSIKAKRKEGVRLPKDFAIKVILAFVALAFCVFKTVALIV